MKQKTRAVVLFLENQIFLFNQHSAKKNSSAIFWLVTCLIQANDNICGFKL